MKPFFRQLWVAIVVLLSGASAFAATEVKTSHLSLSLLSERNAIVPGQETWLGLHFRLEPDWHIYWINPGDSGEPPKVDWKLPSGLAAGSIQWPTPDRIPAPSLVDYGYNDDVLLLVPLHAEKAFTPPSAVITANVHWLVCKDVCVPGKAELQLNLPVAASSAPTESATLFTAARSKLPQPAPANWKLSVQPQKDKFLLNIDTGRVENDVEFFPLVPEQIENAAPQDVNSTRTGAQIELKKSDQLLSTVPSLQGVVVIGGTNSYLVDAPVQQPALTGTVTSTPASTKPLSGATIAGFALLGGIILNLMPCVFPVLSIKALGLMNASAGNRRELRLHGLFYTAGVLCCFWAMLAILFALRGAGRQIGWGFQLQSPAFVASLAALLFLMGLSLAGVFEIGMSWMGLGSSLTARSGYAGSFFTGVLATVVATPCTAPFMGTAVGFALAQSAFSASVVFTALALGLALPYALLCFVPQWARLLPKPGAWMETFKQAMAFPLFAAVIWLVWVFGRQSGVDGATRLLGGLLIVGLGAWLLGRIRRAAIGVMIALILFGAAMWLPFTAAPETRSNTSSNDGGLQWEAFTPEKVQQYRAQGKAVFVDFTAAWCLTCQVNERAVFHSPQVVQKFHNSNIVLLKADWTSYDPVVTKALASFGRSGVPFYVIYSKDPSAQPRPLPDLVTPQTVINALDQLD